MKKSSAVVMTVLASACMAALANQSLDAPLALQPLTPAPAVDSGGEAIDESPQRWFVELSGAPVADGGKRAGAQGREAGVSQQRPRGAA